MQAQSMLGDAEIVAGRQGDAMNFEYEESSEPRRATTAPRPATADVGKGYMRAMAQQMVQEGGESSSGDEQQLSVP